MCIGENMSEKKHYGAIDGLRSIACIGIVMMHVAGNNDYAISGFIYDRLIGSFTNFVFLFMVISAFGMCCGYYDKILGNKISLSEFYKKRFVKILPFFGLLVLLDILISLSINSLYEGFADLTLMFGFLPDAGNIQVIGVGWFIGLVFVFYVAFPFFCVLIENKKRAWIVFIISIIYNFICTNYFEVGRKNILYSACFFIAGGLIYLYRNEIGNINKWLKLFFVACAVIAYYIVSGNAMMCLLVSVVLLSYCVVNNDATGLLNNKLTKFIGNISMEIYLSHMVIFRVIEKIGINTRFGMGWLQYIITLMLTIAGTIVFSIVLKKIIYIVENYVFMRK